MEKQEILRNIPRVDDVINAARHDDGLKNVSYATLAECVRNVLDTIRKDVLSGKITAEVTVGKIDGHKCFFRFIFMAATQITAIRIRSNNHSLSGNRSCRNQAKPSDGFYVKGGNPICHGKQNIIRQEPRMFCFYKNNRCTGYRLRKQIPAIHKTNKVRIHTPKA